MVRWGCRDHVGKDRGHAVVQLAEAAHVASGPRGEETAGPSLRHTARDHRRRDLDLADEPPRSAQRTALVRRGSLYLLGPLLRLWPSLVPLFRLLPLGIAPRRRLGIL